MICLMLLLFLLYVVFNITIKAMRGHKNLQIIGKHANGLPYHHVSAVTVCDEM